MDYLSTTLDLLSIIVVVIVLSAIIWAMLRYYEIIEQAKLYIPSTINIWEKVLARSHMGRQKWSGFWQISLYIK